MSALVPDWVAEFLERRTAVEHVLRQVGAGKREPLTPDECTALANKLSVPAEFGTEPTITVPRSWFDVPAQHSGVMFIASRAFDKVRTLIGLALTDSLTH